MESGDAYWFSRLRACADASEVLCTLAAAVGELCLAGKTGVFLLDDAKRELIMRAGWDEEEGGYPVAESGSVAVSDPEDPLAFCLQSGRPYMAHLPPSAAMRLLGASRSHVLAIPLHGHSNATLGGILAVLERKTEPLTYALAVCEYGALVAEAHLIRERESQFLAEEGHPDQAMQYAAPLLGILGESGVMNHVRAMIAKAAPTGATVLITGETGTGKELAAEAIHGLSPRADGPFMRINCGAIPAEILESELFGHRKGAFSGAHQDHSGLLRSADGGTVLLDEIGDMPIELQVKLLRFLQEMEVRPVGDTRTYTVDCRIIAATNRDLSARIEEGLFRADLYHRLAVFPIHLPPLRERREDIVGLASHFLEKISRRHGRHGLTLSPEAIRTLYAYEFPGNVRELIHEIESAVLMAEGPGPLALRLGRSGANGETDWNLDLKSHLEAIELTIIEQTLARFEGNTTRAAAALNLPRSTLKSKLRKIAAFDVDATGTT